MCTIDKRLPNSELQYKHDIDIFINESGKHSTQFVMVDIIVQRLMMMITKICPLKIHTVTF